MLIRLKNKDTLEIDDFEFRCCVGKYGLKLKKERGRFLYTKGQFKLISLYYRADRVKNIKCNLPKKKKLQKIWVGVMTQKIKNIIL